MGKVLELQRQLWERVAKQARRLGTVTSSEWLNYQWIHLATWPEPGQRSAFWCGTGDYSDAKRVGLRFVYLLHRTRFNHLVTRLFDAAGLGDSQLFVLGRS